MSTQTLQKSQDRSRAANKLQEVLLHIGHDDITPGTPGSPHTSLLTGGFRIPLLLMSTRCCEFILCGARQGRKRASWLHQSTPDAASPPPWWRGLGEAGPIGSSEHLAICLAETLGSLGSRRGPHEVAPPGGVRGREGGHRDVAVWDTRAREDLGTAGPAPPVVISQMRELRSGGTAVWQSEPRHS